MRRTENRRSEARDRSRRWFSPAIRALGAVAHFDPSWGATDDGTTSTWIDRIGGHTVASTSQATRMTYTAASAALNNRPGFVGVSANATKLEGASALAALIGGAINLTVYSVHALSSNAAQSATWCIGTVANTGEYMGPLNGATTGSTNVHRNTGVFSGVVQNTTSPVVVSMVNTPTTCSAWSNGSVANTAANALAPACDLFAVGGLRLSGGYTQHMTGVVGDIIVFLGAHTAAQRMYVEQLIAAKYGWPVLRGLSGFSAANYFTLGAGLGPRGASGVGVWGDILLRRDSTPGSAQSIYRAVAGALGYITYGGAADTSVTIGNGTVTAASPARTYLTSDVGKLALMGITADLSLCRQYFNGVEVGAGTALAGYAPATGSFSLGAGPTGTQAASSFSIFGAAGGNVPQTQANNAARCAAIKAANAFVATGGATPSDGWALNSVAATYANLVGSTALPMTGTLTAAQIIVPTWPW